MIKFIHKPGHNHKGGATLAYELIKHEQGKKIKLSIGFCSHKDVYCKKKGRDAAIKQWVRGNTLEIITKQEKHTETDLHLLVNDLKHLFDRRTI